MAPWRGHDHARGWSPIEEWQLLHFAPRFNRSEASHVGDERGEASHIRSILMESYTVGLEKEVRLKRGFELNNQIIYSKINK